MNHKRGRPKKARAGCMVCKPQKHNALKDTYYCQTRQEQKAILDESEQLDDVNELDRTD